MILTTSKKNIIFTVLTGILFFLLVLISSAETLDEIQEKIDTANKNRQRLEIEIKEYQEQLKTIGNQAVTLQNSIKTLDITTGKITSEVKLVETDIHKTNYTIEDTGQEIKDKEKQINHDSLAIKQAIRQIYETDRQTIFEKLLAKEDLSYFWNDIDDIIQVQARISDQIVTVKSVKADLEIAKAKLEQKKKELEIYNKELTERKQILQSTKKEKANLLSVTKNTETNFQKILQDKLALREALDKEIDLFESQLELKLDPKKIPPAGKGVLSWPLENIFITQNFGKTSESGRLYVSGTHNGVDFRAPVGTKVMSAGSGIVEGVGDTDPICPGASYGKWVFIRYDNGLASAYGHLSYISAKAGQRVKAGDVVGYSGSTGYSTGPHLHMSVFAGQGVKVTTLKSVVCQGTYTIPLADQKAYLDPLIYL